jgi:hypothetical protein
MLAIFESSPTSVSTFLKQLPAVRLWLWIACWSFVIEAAQRRNVSKWLDGVPLTSRRFMIGEGIR